MTPELMQRSNVKRTTKSYVKAMCWSVSNGLRDFGPLTLSRRDWTLRNVCRTAVNFQSQYSLGAAVNSEPEREFMSFQFQACWFSLYILKENSRIQAD